MSLKEDYPKFKTVYGCFKFELYTKKAIAKVDLPLFLFTLLDKFIDDYIFFPMQLKN